MCAPTKPLFPPSRTNVCIETFLSHSWGNERRAEIHSLIQNNGEWVKGFDYQDHSITSAHPIHESETRDLYRAISRIIAGCDVFVVPAGMEGAHSDWMDREIYAAGALHKPIIAVVPNGAKRRWSLACEMADEIVGWRGASIREAILKWMPSERRLAFEQQQVRYQELVRSSRYVGISQMLNALAPQPPRRFGPPQMRNALTAPPPRPLPYGALAGFIVGEDE